ncbi:response regulator [Actinomycetota bacterium Odt1-20B]
MTVVLVVDDQDLIRAGIAAILRTDPCFTSVLEAADGETAVATALEHRPDVILMDIRMPGMDGITAAERILARQTNPPTPSTPSTPLAQSTPSAPSPRIVILTTFDTDEYVFAALRAGSSGFLLKDTPPERLVSAVSAIASGDLLFAPSVTRRLIEAFASRSGAPAARPGALEQLTMRETEVLRLVGRGLANDEIASELVVSEATVKTHLHHTMTKLELRSRAQAVVLAYESGLVRPLAAASN